MCKKKTAIRRPKVNRVTHCTSSPFRHTHTSHYTTHTVTHTQTHISSIGWAEESTYGPLLMVDPRVDRSAWCGLLGDVEKEREQEGWVFFELILKLCFIPRVRGIPSYNQEKCAVGSDLHLFTLDHQQHRKTHLLCCNG